MALFPIHVYWNIMTRLISLSPYEICIANLGTYKRGANTSINSIPQSLLELVPTYAIVPLSDSLMVIPNEEGFALFTIPAVKHRARSCPFRIYPEYVYYLS